jgi:L-iditol 2-dehydrogenase
MSRNKKVRALQCNNSNELIIMEYEKPEPDETSLLLKVDMCGICGSDLHSIEGKRAKKFPFIPGHEIVGTIESLGEKANEHIKIFGADKIEINDRVVVNPRMVCGRCHYCLAYPSNQQLCLNTMTGSSIGSGTPPHLFGGWAEYMYILPKFELIKVPDNLPDEIAVLSEPFSCAVACIDKYKIEHTWKSGDAFGINDAVVIFGAGAIGILMAAGFYHAGAKKIIVADIDQKRLELSKQFGASDIVNVSNTSAEERIEKVMRITNNLGAGIVVEACGVPETLDEGIKMLCRKGKLFEVGQAFQGGTAQIDPYILCKNEIELIGCFAYPSSKTMQYALEILSQRKMPFEKLTELFSIDEYEDVIFKKLTKGAVKPIFKL